MHFIPNFIELICTQVHHHVIMLSMKLYADFYRNTIITFRKQNLPSIRLSSWRFHLTMITVHISEILKELQFSKLYL